MFVMVIFEELKPQHVEWGWLHDLTDMEGGTCLH